MNAVVFAPNYLCIFAEPNNPSNNMPHTMLCVQKLVFLGLQGQPAGILAQLHDASCTFAAYGAGLPGVSPNVSFVAFIYATIMYGKCHKLHKEVLLDMNQMMNKSAIIEVFKLAHRPWQL